MMRHRPATCCMSMRISWGLAFVSNVTYTTALDPATAAGSTHVFLIVSLGAPNKGLIFVRFNFPDDVDASCQIRSAVDLVKNWSISARSFVSCNGFSFLLCSKYNALTSRSAAERGASGPGRLVRMAALSSGGDATEVSCLGFV